MAIAIYVNSDHQWAFELTAQLPSEWRRRLLSRWERMREGGADIYQEVENARNANIEMRETIALLNTIRMPLSATDQDIVERANEITAQSCIGLAKLYHDPAMLRSGNGPQSTKERHRTAPGQRHDRPRRNRQDDRPAMVAAPIAKNSRQGRGSKRHTPGIRQQKPRPIRQRRISIQAHSAK